MESLEHLKTSDPEIEIEGIREKIKIPLRMLKLLATIRRVNWIYMCLAQNTCHPPTIQNPIKAKTSTAEGYVPPGRRMSIRPPRPK